MTTPEIITLPTTGLLVVNPHFPALRTGLMALSWASRQSKFLAVTALEPGSVWNTMPCHTHERRTEV